MAKNNIAYTYQPKFKSPFNDGKTYLVPAYDKQQGKDWNYIIVMCSPKYNGVYKWPATLDVKKWLNLNKVCLYVPLDECTKVCDLTGINDNEEGKEIKKIIKAHQKKWFNKEVRGQSGEYKSKPKWML